MGSRGSERNPAEEKYYMERKRDVLQTRLMMKDEQTKASKQAQEELRQRIVDLDKDFEKEGDVCKETSGEMKRQYREMQEDFRKRIKDLQQKVEQAKQEIETVNKEIERVRVEKDEKIRQKEIEIKTLSNRMETMAVEFADMLRETLNKMSQRIEVTHNSWDRDSGKTLKDLKEFSLNNFAAKD